MATMHEPSNERSEPHYKIIADVLKAGTRRSERKPEILAIKETLFDQELRDKPEHVMGFQWVLLNGDLAVVVVGNVPVSRCIDVQNHRVIAGTFAAPSSEQGFLVTGLSVVARYALPNLLSATLRWPLEAIAGTTVRCEARTFCTPDA